METLRIKPSRGYGAPHAMFAGDGLALTIALGRVPAHSPYRAGDWVQCHGYPGYPAGPQQWGFRGFVLAGMGSTILRGLTDDGREWAEHWGALVPDGTRGQHTQMAWDRIVHSGGRRPRRGPR